MMMVGLLTNEDAAKFTKIWD